MLSLQPKYFTLILLSCIRSFLPLYRLSGFCLYTWRIWSFFICSFDLWCFDLKDFIFNSSFRFTANLRERYRAFPYTCCPRIRTGPLPNDISHQSVYICYYWTYIDIFLPYILYCIIYNIFFHIFTLILTHFSLPLKSLGIPLNLYVNLGRIYVLQY